MSDDTFYKSKSIADLLLATTIDCEITRRFVILVILLIFQMAKWIRLTGPLTIKLLIGTHVVTLTQTWVPETKTVPAPKVGPYTTPVGIEKPDAIPFWVTRMLTNNRAE